MNEQELRQQAEEADKEWKLAKKRLSDAKNKLMAAESYVLECKMNKDRLDEQLRTHIATTPRYDQSLQDLEIERFQAIYPELCAFAKKRDENKP